MHCMASTFALHKVPTNNFLTVLHSWSQTIVDQCEDSENGVGEFALPSV